MLHGKRKRSLPAIMRLRMASQVSMAVAFLHENKIMHRDIKSLNIMVNVHNVCKLADFGSAKLLRSGAQRGQRPDQIVATADILNTIATGTPLWCVVSPSPPLWLSLITLSGWPPRFASAPRTPSPPMSTLLVSSCSSSSKRSCRPSTLSEAPSCSSPTTSSYASHLASASLTLF